MAPQLKITTTGHGSVSRTAERGVLRITVTTTCSKQAEASQKVQDTTGNLTQKFRSHAAKTTDGLAHPSAGITAFLASAMRSSSHLPYDEMHRPRAEAFRQYTATTTFQVIFRDLGLLADTAAELGRMPFVSIDQTEWRLTDASKAEMVPEARAKAIRDAVRIAEDHAAAVGRKVAAVEIKDKGVVFPNQGGHGGQGGQMIQQAAPTSSIPATSATVIEQGSSIQPGTITASCTIGVDFLSVDDS